VVALEVLRVQGVQLAPSSAPDPSAALGREQVIDAVAVAVEQVEPVSQVLQLAMVESVSHQISLRLPHMLNMAAVVLDRP
jgi:hypothetical protein